MGYKANRRRAKVLREIRQTKEAKKRRIERRIKKHTIRPERGTWNRTNPLDIHMAIVGFLRTTTKSLVPNLIDCRVISRDQGVLSDLALETKYGYIGYQQILISGDEVTIHVHITCRESIHGAQKHLWYGLLPDPRFFDKLSEFVAKICTEYYNLVEYQYGSKLYR